MPSCVSPRFSAYPKMPVTYIHNIRHIYVTILTQVILPNLTSKLQQFTFTIPLISRKEEKQNCTHRHAILSALKLGVFEIPGASVNHLAHCLVAGQILQEVRPVPGLQNNACCTVTTPVPDRQRL